MTDQQPGPAALDAVLAVDQAIRNLSDLRRVLLRQNAPESTEPAHLAAFRARLATELRDAANGSIQQAVTIAVGAATACWDNLEAAGTFESEHACVVVDELIRVVEDYCWEPS